MPTLDKFDGIGYPKSYLKMYTRAMQPLWVTEKMSAQMFQNTLMGTTFRWFLNVKDKVIGHESKICSGSKIL